MRCDVANESPCAQAIPRALQLKGIYMNTEIASAFTPALSADRLLRDVPAAFADRAHEDVSSTYVFISTSQLVSALTDAGFQPVTARQTRARGDRAGFTKHMIRFRHVRDSVTLVDAVPELILINAHDATSAYQLRAGLFRPVCTNGMMARIGDFGLIHVPHRGNVIANVVEAALTITRGFADIGTVIERMARTVLSNEQRVDFAHAAAQLRYNNAGHIPYAPSRLLEARRAIDQGDDVWHVYNVVQENVMRGGVIGTSASGRATRTRGIRAIREDVRINTGLWHLAMNLLRG